jgi:predicted enzyme related to lactoylglutathione lyase
MPGPAPAGLFVYAKDLPRLAGFYEALLAMRRVVATGDLVVLDSPDIQLTLHAIPPAIAATIAIADPPRPRDDAALKFFFTVPSLAAAANAAPALGGTVLVEEWRGPGFRVRNAVDPEGNIFQLRETTTA